MSERKIKSGETVHFVELTSGQKLTGTFKLDQEGIHASICSYENYFFIKQEEPIVLLTEKNQIVSLHSILTSPLSNNSFMIGPKRTVDVSPETGQF
jgi:hypothetical protein